MLTASMKILNLEWPLVPVQIEQLFSKAIQPTSIPHGLDIITPYAICFLKPSLLTGLPHHPPAGIEVIDEMLVKSIYNALTEICLKLTANSFNCPWI